MINYFRKFKERTVFASMLLAITLWGAVFIPFVPVVVLFGGFNDDNGVNSGIANGMASMLMVVVLGLVVYGTLFLTLVRNNF